MTEFKMKELGWYECIINGKRADKIEIIFYDKVTNKFVGRHSTTIYSFYENGKSCIYSFYENGKSCQDYSIQITKYIGKELPKEPREFKFEAYLQESPNNRFDIRINTFIKYDDETIRLYSGPPEIKEGTNTRNSKWEITMRELPCEKPTE